jgi:hypothetical protein
MDKFRIIAGIIDATLSAAPRTEVSRENKNDHKYHFAMRIKYMAHGAQIQAK